MNNNRSTAVLAVVVILAAVVNGTGALPNPFKLIADWLKPDAVQVPVLPGDVPDMSIVFGANKNKADAKRHAYVTSKMLGGLRRCMEFELASSEGDRGITTGGKAEDVRIRYRRYRELGFSFSSLYPDGSGSGFCETVDGFLTKRIGKNGSDAMTDEQFKKWIKAYGDLENATLLAWSKM